MNYSIADLIFNDGEIMIRPESVSAIYKKNRHNGNVWDIDVFLANGKVLSISLDDDICRKVMHQIMGVKNEKVD